MIIKSLEVIEKKMKNISHKMKKSYIWKKIEKFEARINWNEKAKIS